MLVGVGSRQVIKSRFHLLNWCIYILKYKYWCICQYYLSVTDQIFKCDVAFVVGTYPTNYHYHVKNVLDTQDLHMQDQIKFLAFKNGIYKQLVRYLYLCHYNLVSKGKAIYWLVWRYVNIQITKSKNGIKRVRTICY